MASKNFKDLVLMAKEDSDMMLRVLELLQPLIKAYTKKIFFLEHEDAQQELSIAIIEAIKKIENCESDGQCLTYINNAVRFKFSYLCKKNLKKERLEDVYIKEINVGSYFEKYEDVETAYDLQIKGKNMSQKKKAIMNYLLLGYSDSEIAKALGISRQYINRIKKSFI